MMNKIVFLIIVFINIIDDVNLFINANPNVEFILGKIEQQLFKHDKQTTAVLKNVENKLNDILHFSHSLSCNTDQQCCTKINNVSNDIENIKLEIIGSVNKITTLTENSNSQNVLLNNLLTIHDSLKRLNKQQVDDINDLKHAINSVISKKLDVNRQMLETLHKTNTVGINDSELLTKLKNEVDIISNNLINLINEDVTSSINKIITESIKELIKEKDIKINELSTQLRRIELNQKEIISKLNLKNQNNALDTKQLINNVTIENEYNRKKSVDQLIVQIDTIKNDITNYLTVQAKETTTLYQQESEKIFQMRKTVDEILVRIKTIENGLNEKHYEKSLDLFEVKMNIFEVELQDIKLQNKEVLNMLQHFRNSASYSVYTSFNNSEYLPNEYSNFGNDSYEHYSESEQ
ncbi:putative leucine-rich repeat-containing protein DDB_G0290503 [Onthophagus taurus]|uniref:putative leucine-rich repeat-containing protein DDB_G0290503 n=1 Tax=Onthophagus taurus TaxID=166361 RepID=UPI000C20CE32|nr:protein PFC0760c-like [Onthophagus taurus]